jgi:hypothetical protein
MRVRLIAKEVEDNGKFEFRNQKFEKSGREFAATDVFVVRGIRSRLAASQIDGGAKPDAEKDKIFAAGQSTTSSKPAFARSHARR